MNGGEERPGKRWEKPEGQERKCMLPLLGGPYSPLPEDAIDGGLYMVHTAWCCLPLVSEKVWS